MGPRALGARSILADVRSRAMLSRVNRLKGREAWRPLAPSVLAEHFHNYFEGVSSPFMLCAAHVKEHVRRLVPAIVHVDGSARPQAVERETNPLFHQLISDVRSLTGFPMVLNTSFNLSHEPIVNTPADAVRSFLASELDVLALGTFLVMKRRDVPEASALNRYAGMPGGGES